MHAETEDDKDDDLGEDIESVLNVHEHSESIIDIMYMIGEVLMLSFFFRSIFQPSTTTRESFPVPSVP